MCMMKSNIKFVDRIFVDTFCCTIFCHKYTVGASTCPLLYLIWEFFSQSSFMGPIKEFVFDTNFGLQQKIPNIIQINPEGYDAWCGFVCWQIHFLSLPEYLHPDNPPLTASYTNAFDMHMHIYVSIGGVSADILRTDLCKHAHLISWYWY